MPMDAEPLVRARFCQEWLELVDKEEEPWRGRFFAALDPALRETIESATRVAWLPMAVHVKLADIQQGAFGAVRSHAHYRKSFAAALRGPFLGPLVRTGARVMGISMLSIVRWSSRAYQAGFRNVGELAGEVLGPHRARLVYSELPTVCTSSDAWMLSSQGSAYGAYDFLGIEGVVRLDTSGRGLGRMILELEWSGAAAKPPP
jgi:hypothetical protein